MGGIGGGEKLDKNVVYEKINRNKQPQQKSI